MQERQRLGETLRAARLAKGVSLEEAAAATRIRRSALQALETEEFDSLPASVYTRGFLVNYARYLGLISEEIVEEFDRQQCQRDEPEVSAAPREESGRRSSFFSSKILWGIVFLVALGIVLNFVYQEFLSAGLAPASAEPQVEATPTAEPTPVVAVRPPRTPTPVPTVTPTPLPETIPITGISLSLRSTTQKAWISVTVDGDIVYVGSIGPDTDQGTASLTWSADESVYITFGRTGGIEISINDREVGPLIESKDPIIFEAIKADDGNVLVTVNGEVLSPPE